jgi:ABC-type lipoprotein release transport system permease subunit
VAVGLTVGLVAASWLTRVLQRWLFEVSPNDPATLVAVSLLLIGTALLAAYLPARRACRINPIDEVRAE